MEIAAPFSGWNLRVWAGYMRGGHNTGPAMQRALAASFAICVRWIWTSELSRALARPPSALRPAVVVSWRHACIGLACITSSDEHQ